MFVKINKDVAFNVEDIRTFSFRSENRKIIKNHAISLITFREVKGARKPINPMSNTAFI